MSRKLVVEEKKSSISEMDVSKCDSSVKEDVLTDNKVLQVRDLIRILERDLIRILEKVDPDAIFQVDFYNSGDPIKDFLNSFSIYKKVFSLYGNANYKEDYPENHSSIAILRYPD